MNAHYKTLRNASVTVVAAVTAIVWGIAELIALQRARLGGPPRR